MISLNATKLIFKKEGAKRVSKNAALELKKILEQKAKEIAKNAIKNAFYAGRVVVKAEDVKENV